MHSYSTSVSSQHHPEVRVNDTKTAKRKNKFYEQALLDPRMGEKSSHLYTFLGRVRPPWWGFLLLGAFSAILMKNYQVVVEKDVLVLARMNLFGKVENIDRIPYSEIQSFRWKSRLLTHRFSFVLKNGRKLNFDSNHRAVVRVEGMLSSDEALNFIQSKVV